MLHDCLFAHLLKTKQMTDVCLVRNCQQTVAKNEWKLPTNDRHGVPNGWRAAMRAQAWGCRIDAARCQIAPFVERNENEGDSDEEDEF